MTGGEVQHVSGGTGVVLGVIPTIGVAGGHGPTPTRLGGPGAEFSPLLTSAKMHSMRLPSTGRRFTLRILVLVVVLLVVAAACGSRSESAGSGSEDPAPGATDPAVEGPSGEVPPEANPDGVTDQATTGSDTQPAPPSSSIPSSTTVAGVEDPPLPVRCRGIDLPLQPREITFVLKGRLFARDFAGNLRCLADVRIDKEMVPVTNLRWSPQSDAALLDRGRVITMGGGGRRGGDASYTDADFSVPSGTALIWAEEGRIALASTTREGFQILEGPVPPDVPPAGRFMVEGVVYHPDGLHLLVWGRDGTTDRSRLLVTAENGTGASLLMESGSAVISDVVVTPDGARVLFVLSGDGTEELRVLDLESATVVDESGEEAVRSLPPVRPEDTTLLYEGVRPLSHVVVEPDGPRVLFAEGTCEAGSEVLMVDLGEGGYEIPAAPGVSGVPIGFLTHGSVVIEGFGGTCGDPGPLLNVDVDSGGVETVMPRVEVASMRVMRSQPRFNLLDVQMTPAGYGPPPS